MFSETVPELKGIWNFKLYRGDSREACDLVDDFTKVNLVVNSGKAHILDREFGLNSAVAMTGIQVGTSATAAAVGDTAITSGGVSGAFKAFTTCTRTGLVVTAVSDFGTADANMNINECGILTASNGVLLNRIVLSGTLAKSTSLSLQITVSITQS